MRVAVFAPPPVALPSVGFVIAATAVLRLLFAWGLGFGVDEGYAVTVARPLSLSYFDHAPLHFWIAGAMTWATGTTEPLVIRLPFIALFSCTTWAVAGLARHASGELAARVTALALSVSGVLGLTGGTWVLPDGPLLCFAALGAYSLAPVLAPCPGSSPVTPRDALWRWIGAGAAFGIAVLSKYHGVLFVAGLALLVLGTPSRREQLRTVGPWLAALLVCAACVPIVWWNATHDWASFAFQGARAVAPRWSLTPFVEMVGGQLAWLLPWISIPLLLSLRFAPRHHAQPMLLALAAGPILIFSLIPLGGARGLPHWPAPGWLFVFPLLGAWVAGALEAQRRWAWWWLRGAPAASVALVLLVVAHARWQVLDGVMSDAQRRADPTRDTRSWAPALHATASDDVLLVRSWVQGGQLGVASGAGPRAIVCLCTDPHHFGYRPGAPRPWERGVLIERLQPWRRDWQPATALAGDSLRIVVRDTVVVEGSVLLARYDVTRRSAEPRAAASW